MWDFSEEPEGQKIHYVDQTHKGMKATSRREVSGEYSLESCWQDPDLHEGKRKFCKLGGNRRKTKRPQPPEVRKCFNNLGLMLPTEQDSATGAFSLVLRVIKLKKLSKITLDSSFLEYVFLLFFCRLVRIQFLFAQLPQHNMSTKL